MFGGHSLRTKDTLLCQEWEDNHLSSHAQREVKAVEGEDLGHLRPALLSHTEWSLQGHSHGVKSCSGRTEVREGKDIPHSHLFFFVQVQSLRAVWLFCDPMDWGTPGSSVHGISQARILEWVAIAFRGSYRPKDRYQGLLHCKQSPTLQVDFLPTESPVQFFYVSSIGPWETLKSEGLD